MVHDVKTQTTDDRKQRDSHSNHSSGAWAQGECIWIEDAAGAADHASEYKIRMARGQLTVSTHKPDALRVRELAAEKRLLEKDLAAQLASLRDTIGWAYDELKHHAPEGNPGVASAMERLLDAYQRPTSGNELLDKAERMESALQDIASFSDYPASAPKHEICHALVVEVPDLAEQALRGPEDADT